VSAPGYSLLTHWPTRVVVALLVALCAAASLLFMLYFNGIGPDDPWITYRYAENIATGRGFVFNVGERVYGTSTPLYALLLAGARMIGLPVPQTSWVIGFMSMNASIIMIYFLARRLHGQTAGLAAAGLLASAYYFHRVATFGMEAPLYSALIIGAFLAFAYDRVNLAALLAAACVWMRLDGAAVGAALALGYVVIHRRIPWKAAAIYAAVVAPWFIFSTVYFGSPLPNTMGAKRMHTLYTRLYWMPRWLVSEPRFWLGLVGVGATLASPTLRWRALPFAMWGGMYAVAYSLVAMHRYDWYLMPMVLPLAAFAGIGVTWLAERVGAFARYRQLATVALALALTPVDAAHVVWRLMGNEGILEVERARFEAALWIRDNVPADAPIATGGIGLVGYFTGRHIYDAMGLVTPGSQRIDYEIEDPRSVPFPRFLPAILEDYDPEWVFDGFGLEPGQDMPDFMRGRYEVVREWRREPHFARFILYRRLSPARGGTGSP
jgi:hypothetical protein